MAVSHKVKHALSYDPAITYPGTYSSEMNTNIHYTNICTRMFTEVLFVITKNWKHPIVLQLANGSANCGKSIYRPNTQQ